MRLLLIDVGNSRLKWAHADRAGLGPVQALAHDGDPARLVAQIPQLRVDAVRIANVTGAAHAAALAEAIRQRHGCAPVFAESAAAHAGLRSAYAEPQRLGVDRWLNLLAARRRSQGGAACIASAGTALTFDAVDAGGQHLGGIIAPGLMTAQQAVLGATRFAAAGPDAAYDAGLGRDTEACVRQGALHACAGLVDRLARRYPQALLLLTGGDAGLLQPHLECADWQLAPDLVLEGLLDPVEGPSAFLS